MTLPLSLWLPILVSAAAVFIASSIVHMAPLWHGNDYPELPNEEQVRAALGPLRLPPGDYFIPRPGNREQMRSSGFAEKMKEGPVMTMTVMPNGMTPMGKNLISWFVYVLITVFLVAEVTGHAVAAGNGFGHVFKITGIAAFLGFTMGLWQLSIWYRRSLSLSIKATLDGIIYAAVTAATFAWLWPR